MPETWTGTLVGRMHNHRITNADLAEELGVTAAYVSMVLNGKRKPPGIRKRMTEAVKAVIDRRNTEELLADSQTKEGGCGKHDKRAED